MITFYQGTLDTVMERLGESISNFDGSWLEKCVPAAEANMVIGFPKCIWII